LLLALESNDSSIIGNESGLGLFAFTVADDLNSLRCKLAIEFFQIKFFEGYSSHSRRSRFCFDLQMASSIAMVSALRLWVSSSKCVATAPSLSTPPREPSQLSISSFSLMLLRTGRNKSAV